MATTATSETTVLYWIYDVPTPTLALLFALVFVGFSWLGTVLIRPLLRPFIRSRNGANDLVGYVLSCFCVFYGLLLGLLAVAAYQNYSQVEATVAQESGSLGTLYRSVSGYPEPERSDLQAILRDHCRYVIEEAWPLQQKGITPEGGVERLGKFQTRLAPFEPKTRSQEAIHAQTLRQFGQYAEIQRSRLYSVTAGIPAVMWYVVVVGSVINIALVWLFEMKWLSHLFLGGLLAFFLGAVVFLIAAMDNPFRGEVSVTPDAFRFIYEKLMQP
jgi:hypothetical protein